MFTRTIELTLKPNIKPEFFKKFKTDVLPILKKTSGFFDLVVLEQEAEVNKLFFLSFWETKTNAEYYEEQFYPKVRTIIESFYSAAPVVKYWNLEESFSEKLFTKTMV